MTDLPAAIAAAREVLADIDARGMSFIAAERTTLIDTMRNLLSALDAAQGEAVPAKGLRDSALNSARFRARCYALVGIVEGIAGLGRNWTANGERLKDTREWVAFYNCVASMRNGTFNQASAEQAQQPAAAVPAEWPLHSTQDCYEHFLAYSGLEDSPWIKYAYFHGADVGLDRPSKPAPVAPAAAVPAGYDEDEIADACMMAEVSDSKYEAVITYLSYNRRAMLAAARKGE